MTMLPDYFAYLCEIVCVDGRYTDESYWILAEELWNTDYRWSLWQDENRSKSVSVLRKRYLNAGGTDIYDGIPSVLEVLVMLSDAMHDLMDELDGEDRRPMYFWEMIDNLGLIRYTDALFRENFDRKSGYLEQIRKKIDIWMDRRFGYDGRRSPFPLKNARENQRTVDLWYQMQAYLVENY